MLQQNKKKFIKGDQSMSTKKSNKQMDKEFLKKLREKSTKVTAVFDSGERTHFDTGAEKDITFGRGRFDLLPLHMVARIYEQGSTYSPISNFIDHIDRGTKVYVIEDKIEAYTNAFATFVTTWYEGSYNTAIKEIAIMYELGAVKYDARDWEKGRPEEVYINSTLRHFFQFLNGKREENHKAAVLWNLISLMDTLRRLPHMAHTHAEIYDHEKS